MSKDNVNVPKVPNLEPEDTSDVGAESLKSFVERTNYSYVKEEPEKMSIESVIELLKIEREKETDWRKKSAISARIISLGLIKE